MHATNEGPQSAVEPTGPDYRTVWVHRFYQPGVYRRVPAHSRQREMPTCNHCNAHVSDQFARVFADETGRVHACPSCSANAGIAEVARERAHEIEA